MTEAISATDNTNNSIRLANFEATAGTSNHNNTLSRTNLSKTSTSNNHHNKDEDILNPSYKRLSTKPHGAEVSIRSRIIPNDKSGLYPGPGSYQLGASWNKSGVVRMMPALNKSIKEAEVIVPAELNIPSPKARSATVTSRLPEIGQREVRPGPGYYDMSTSFKSNASIPNSPRDNKSCTFGSVKRGESINPTMFFTPGPGAYQPNDSAVRVSKSSTLSPRHNDARPKNLPGPGSYNFKSPFDKDQSIKNGISIKGRLQHPMDDHLASHECARTSAPRDGSLKMKASPRL